MQALKKVVDFMSAGVLVNKALNRFSSIFPSSIPVIFGVASWKSLLAPAFGVWMGLLHMPDFAVNLFETAPKGMHAVSVRQFKELPLKSRSVHSLSQMKDV